MGSGLTDGRIPHLGTWHFETRPSTSTSRTLRFKACMALKSCEEFFRMSSLCLLTCLELFEMISQMYSGYIDLTIPTLAPDISNPDPLRQLL